jgi:hypothetical protein
MAGRSPAPPASVDWPPIAGPRGDAVEKQPGSIWKFLIRMQRLRGSPPSRMLARLPDMRQGESNALVNPRLREGAQFYRRLRACGPKVGFRPPAPCVRLDGVIF